MTIGQLNDRNDTPRATAEPAAPTSCLAPRALAVSAESVSAVVVHLELVRVRTEPHRVDLVRALVVDPRLDQVWREEAALEQVLVVGLQALEDLLQRAWHLRDRQRLVRRKLVEVLVHRLGRLDLVPD